MKQVVLIVLFLFELSLANARQEIISHLTDQLSVTTVDTSKAILLDSLSMYYLFFSTKSDSALYYINESINFTFGLKDKKYLILAYARMGFYYVNTSQYKAALDISLKGVRFSENNHIPDFLSALYYNLAWVYYNLGDPGSGLNYAFEGQRNLKDNKDPFYDQPLHILGLIGNIYLDNSKQDSALYYFKQVDSIASYSKELAAKDISDWYWGMYYLTIENYPKADSIFSLGIIHCEKNGDFMLNTFLLFEAQSNLGQGKIPRAITVAARALDYSLLINDKGTGTEAATLLRTCYDRMENRDSAYYYLKLRDSLRAIIISKGSAKEIQQIRFEQQLGQKEDEANQILQNEKNRNKITSYIFITALVFFLILAAIQWRNNKQKKKANALLLQQKEKVESAISELKATQAQLIQSEKMASLGELTAGIAHEIQNPLNFVNNFSEVSNELIDEMSDELDKGGIQEAKAIASDIKQNLEKINHHGKRADAIVKGMLQHSQSSSGIKEPIDINKLCDEFIRLSYHGLRAKDTTFICDFKLDLDPNLPMVNVVSQDIGRVLLNIINNAFQACTERGRRGSEASGEERRKEEGKSYSPLVTITSKNLIDKVEIKVTDNGNGIPQKILDKIFQPFFTTKPTGQGTGLGLSLSYDIVKAHGGTIEVKSYCSPPGGSINVISNYLSALPTGQAGDRQDREPGEFKVKTKEKVGTIFTVLLPVNPVV